jgi:multimeric flavodoxin WrbA
MKRVLIISASPREGGNSDTLCDQFAKGAKSSGHDVEKIMLKDKRIAYCTGCRVCLSKHVCSQKDDMGDILEKMIQSDVIVLASPVYFYSINAQLKTFIDRCCPRYREIKYKDFYFLITASDRSVDRMQRTIETLRGFTEDCLPGANEAGIVYGVGAWDRGEILYTPAYTEAFEMGKAC